MEYAQSAGLSVWSRVFAKEYAWNSLDFFLLFLVLLPLFKCLDSRDWKVELQEEWIYPINLLKYSYAEQLPIKSVNSKSLFTGR